MEYVGLGGPVPTAVNSMGPGGAGTSKFMGLLGEVDLFSGALLPGVPLEDPAAADESTLSTASTNS